MRTLLTVWLITFATGPKVDIFEQRLIELNSEYEALLDQIRDIEDPAQKISASEKVREYTSAWSFGGLYTPNFSDELQEESTEEILIASVYGAFTGEQAHYERTIIHTDGDDERARQIMILRAETLCRIYPIGRRIGIDEDIRFAQLILRIYKHAPEAVAAVLKRNLVRWRGDERATALLILDHHGDLTAKNELKDLDSERVKQLTPLTKAHLKRR